MAKTCPICNTSYPDDNAFCTNDGSTLRAEETSEDLVGTVIADRYQVTKLLGEGGMGRVYLAKHVRLPQQAAIKVLHPGMIRDAGAVARFNREAGNAARIEHDRVARVFDFGETSDGLVYLAMEFVPGRTLRELLLVAEQGRLSPGRAANITYQVSDGLDAAHRIGIIHRDLKPDNILVITDENGVDRSKVVDFGIAKAVDSKASQQTQLTQTGMLVGTPEFMSPEQVLGETLDARSDVYALALVSYQLFTGTLPFGGTTPERSLAARLLEDAKPLSAAAPDIDWPPALQEAFDHALAREPGERTSSAREFGDAVVAAVEQWIGVSVLRGRTPMSTPSIITSAPLLTPPSTATTARTRATPLAAAAVPPIAVETTSVPAKSSSKMGMMLVGGGLLVVAAATIMVLMPTGDAADADTSTSTPTVTADSASVATNASGSAPRNPAGGAPTAGSDAANRVAVQSQQGAGAGNQPATIPAGSPPEVGSNAGATVPTAGESAELVADRARLTEWKSDLQGPDGERIAPIVINSVTQMLPRLRTPADSFQAYLRRFEAKVLSTEGDRMVSCPDLDNAKRMARKLSTTEMALLKPWDALGCPD